MKNGLFFSHSFGACPGWGFVNVVSVPGPAMGLEYVGCRHARHYLKLISGKELAVEFCLLTPESPTIPG